MDPETLAREYNFWRYLGANLDKAQPGLCSPLPDESPDIVDALKIIDLADKLRLSNQEQATRSVAL